MAYTSDVLEGSVTPYYIWCTYGPAITNTISALNGPVPPNAYNVFNGSVIFNKCDALNGPAIPDTYDVIKGRAIPNTFGFLTHHMMHLMSQWSLIVKHSVLTHVV